MGAWRVVRRRDIKDRPTQACVPLDDRGSPRASYTQGTALNHPPSPSGSFKCFVWRHRKCVPCVSHRTLFSESTDPPATKSRFKTLAPPITCPITRQPPPPTVPRPIAGMDAPPESPFVLPPYLVGVPCLPFPSPITHWPTLRFPHRHIDAFLLRYT